MAEKVRLVEGMGAPEHMSKVVVMQYSPLHLVSAEVFEFARASVAH
jgi:hypothetical protein